MLFGAEAAQIAEKAANAAGHEESAGDAIIHEVTNSNIWHFFGNIEIHLPAFISLHVVMLWISAVVVLLLFWGMARSMSKDKNRIARGGFALLEMLVIFVRDEIAITTMGEKLGRRMMSLILTFFFFILMCNLLGLFPFLSTPTGNINVTAGLALITFIMIQVQGMRENGILGYWKSLVPPGIPTPVIPLMIPVEFIGLFTKPFALCMRLFANMIAGHMVIYSFLALIFILGTIIVAPFSVAFAIFIFLLELLVAFIQAYIFAMLSGLFIGMAAHPEH